jgi:hypothetical protein
VSDPHSEQQGTTKSQAGSNGIAEAEREDALGQQRGARVACSRSYVEQTPRTKKIPPASEPGELKGRLTTRVNQTASRSPAFMADVWRSGGLTSELCRRRNVGTELLNRCLAQEVTQLFNGLVAADKPFATDAVSASASPGHRSAAMPALVKLNSGNELITAEGDLLGAARGLAPLENESPRRAV